MHVIYYLWLWHFLLSCAQTVKLTITKLIESLLVKLP